MTSSSRPLSLKSVATPLTNAATSLTTNTLSSLQHRLESISRYTPPPATSITITALHPIFIVVPVLISYIPTILRVSYFIHDLPDYVLLYADGVEPLTVVGMSFTLMGFPRSNSKLTIVLLWIYAFTSFLFPVLYQALYNYGFYSAPSPALQDTAGVSKGVVFTFCFLFGVLLFRLGLRVRLVVAKFSDSDLSAYLTSTLLTSYFSVGPVAYLILETRSCIQDELSDLLQTLTRAAAEIEVNLRCRNPVNAQYILSYWLTALIVIRVFFKPIVSSSSSTNNSNNSNNSKQGIAGVTLAQVAEFKSLPARYKFYIFAIAVVSTFALYIFSQIHTRGEVPLVNYAMESIGTLFIISPGMIELAIFLARRRADKKLLKDGGASLGGPDSPSVDGDDHAEGGVELQDMKKKKNQQHRQTELGRRAAAAGTGGDGEDDEGLDFLENPLGALQDQLV
jgi:hypothetical protein